jgi:hypothetical protein
VLVNTNQPKEINYAPEKKSQKKTG